MSVGNKGVGRRIILKAGAFVGAAVLMSSYGLGSAIAASEEEWAKIIEASKQEGSVTYYMVNPDMSDALRAGFKKAYPWLDLTIFAAPSVEGMVSKLMIEHSLGQYTADVVHSRELHLPVYQKEGVIDPFVLPNDSNLPAALQDPTGYFHPMYQVPVLLAYNKNIVPNPPDDDLFSLADPIWAGKVGMDNPRNKGPSWNFLASRRALWGEEKWLEWLAGLKANNVRTFSTASDAYQAVVRGDIALAIATYGDIYQNQTEGSPTDGVWYEDVMTFTLGVSLVNNAPHPNAAKLFMDWILSEEGQLEFSAVSRIPTVPVEGGLSLAGIKPDNVELMPQSEVRPFYEQPDELSDTVCSYVQC